RDALFTLFDNLIDNALRYTPRSGRVDVAVERAVDAGGNEIVLSVSDNGPGIAPHERERVFDRFHRGEAARAASDTRGSGLGLAIVKRIAERHGAKVVIGEDAGSPGLAIEVRFPDPSSFRTP
ncbi:MAG: sensor histidine kinase, partial [Burkholderiaceae bacterium]